MGFIAFLAFLALANAQSCDECKDGVKKLGEYLQTPAEIEAVEQALGDLVCPTLPEDQIGECIDFVYTNWPDIAKALFDYPDTYTNICMGIGYCKKTVMPRITCDQCKVELGKISTLLGTEEFAQMVATDLEGPIYCGNTDYVAAEDMQACVDFLKLVDVQAVNALGSLLTVSA